MKTPARIGSNQLLRQDADTNRLIPESEIALTLIERDYQPRPGEDGARFKYETVRFAVDQHSVRGLMKALAGMAEELDALEKRAAPLQPKTADTAGLQPT